jgi:hypothetical protein
MFDDVGGPKAPADDREQPAMRGAMRTAIRVGASDSPLRYRG